MTGDRQGQRREALITLGLAHFSNTVETYQGPGDDNPAMYGYALSKLVPDLPMAHGAVLRVTVEVVFKGVPCPVRKWKDEGCTRDDGEVSHG